MKVDPALDADEDGHLGVSHDGWRPLLDEPPPLDWDVEDWDLEDSEPFGTTSQASPTD